MRRPILIIQSNPFNESRIATVVVAVITSNLDLADAPGNVRIGKSDSGLSKASVVNVSQLVTIDRSLLSRRVRLLSAALLHKIDDGLRLVVGI
jgi:mRNA interferase MazF